MATDKLTDIAVRKAKPQDKLYKLSDGGGMYLEVRPNGARYWRLKYRIGGFEKGLSLGVYPDGSLAVARSDRDTARKLIADGTDPSGLRKAAKVAKVAEVQAGRLEAAGLPASGSFEHVARDWLATVHRNKVSAGHADRTLVRFEKDIFPFIGRRPINAIEAPELLACLRRIEARGAIETAHRGKDAAGQVFRYGIATGECTRNPAADLRDALRPVESGHHAAIVDPKQAGALLRDMLAYQGHPVTRAALALSALLMLRPGELRHLEWAWIDLEATMLTVPGEAMKRMRADKASGPPHLVPLAPQAVAVLRELQPLTGHGRYVFPSLMTGERCMSENTVRSALRRMGYSNDDMTAHGFRAMARTMIAERLGVAPEVIEAQLAHAVSDALGRAYNRTQYLDQRVEMMGKWADYLDRLRAGAQVLPFKAA
ncbi:MAG: integrase arm-type DNA-binding domain-containing protein [Rhodoferax sp.]|nr:integrase arm-type DNA-binding domain-containing protein [Rhodoferax sp.]